MTYQNLLYASYAAIVFAMSVGIFCLGKICAQRVWARTKKLLNVEPYLIEVFVPYSTSVEAIFIFLAVMLRSPYMLALTIYRELKLEAWEKSPGMRAVDYYSRSRLDLLGSVANMISGYPERADAFFHQQLADLRVQEYRAYLNDYLALQESQPGNRLAIG